MHGALSISRGGIINVLEVRPHGRRLPLSRKSRILTIAKLGLPQGDGNPRKPSLQTHATNPAISAAAMVQPDLASVQEQLEKLYILAGDSGASEGLEMGVQALQDVDALLQDLQGLDLELESALEVALEDFSDLTVRSTLNHLYSCCCILQFPKFTVIFPQVFIAMLKLFLLSAGCRQRTTRNATTETISKAEKQITKDTEL